MFSRTPGWLLTCLVLVMFTSTRALSEPEWVKEAIKASEGVVSHDDATSVTLYKSIEIKVASDGSSKTHVRNALRILAPRDEGHCDVNIPTYPDCTVHGLRGWWIKADGSTEKLKDKDVARWAPFHGTGYYDDHINVMASFHNAAPGDIVAYEYEVKDRERWGRYYMRIVLQYRQPVLQTVIEVDVPSGWEVQSAARNVTNIRKVVSENKYTWMIGQLEYQPDEPLSPPLQSLERRLSISWHHLTEQNSGCFSDWASVARWTDSIFGAAAHGDLLEDVGGDLASGQATCFARTQSICRFVRDNIRYVAVEIGEGRVVPRPPAKTLQNRYGDCKDKVVLTGALLAQHGIQCSPVLVPVGTDIDVALPTPFQFNHVILAIRYDDCFEGSSVKPSTSRDWVFFDPTAPYCELGQLPWMDHGATVLVTGAESGLHHLPRISAVDNSRSYYIKCHLAEDGSVEGTVRIVDYGLRGRRVADWRKSQRVSQVLEDLQGALASVAPGATTDGLTLHADRDSAWVSYRLHLTDFVQQTGDLFIMRPGLVPERGLPSLPNIQRKHAIWFGDAEQVETQVHWSFDDRWLCDSTDHEVAFECGIAGMTGHIRSNTNGLSFSWIFRSDGEQLEPDEYARVRSFRRKVEGFRDSKIILRNSR